MKIIFFGLGSIGQRHARLLVKSGGHELFALRTHQGDAPAPDFPVQTLQSWDQVDMHKPQIAFITNPTSLHIPTAIECAKRGMALFMEKPLGSSEEGLQELLDIIQKKRLVTYMAYVMRFHPIILYLKEILDKEPGIHMRVEAASFLPAWRPGRDHKKIYSSIQALGGGIVFDLSHEIDYTDFLLGGVESIKGVCARRCDVTLDTEDCVDMHIQAAKGFASVHMSYISHLNQRKITLGFSDRTITADLINNEICIYRQNTLSQKIPMPIERDELFQRQLDFFLENIRNPGMMNSIPQASGLFRTIVRFKEQTYAPA